MIESKDPLSSYFLISFLFYFSLFLSLRDSRFIFLFVNDFISTQLTIRYWRIAA